MGLQPLGMESPELEGTGVRAAEFPAVGMTTEHSLWKELPARPLGAGTVPSEHVGSKAPWGWNSLARSQVLTPKPSTHTFPPRCGTPFSVARAILASPAWGFWGRR